MGLKKNTNFPVFALMDKLMNGHLMLLPAQQSFPLLCQQLWETIPLPLDTELVGLYFKVLHFSGHEMGM